MTASIDKSPQCKFPKNKLRLVAYLLQTTLISCGMPVDKSLIDVAAMSRCDQTQNQGEET